MLALVRRLQRAGLRCGREAGTWAARVHDGQFEYNEGAAANPNVTVSADSDDWLKVLRGEARPDTDGRAGRKSLELILGIYESAKTGREVPIPLRTRL